MCFGCLAGDRGGEKGLMSDITRGKLIVISGPSGSGKTTISSKLLDLLPDLEDSISFTTRRPRTGERNSRDYYFISSDEFQKGIKENKFLEYAVVFGHYYGTDNKWILDRLDRGKNILLTIDVQGAAQIKANFPQAVLVFLMPPGEDVLRERLTNRATDDPEEIRNRLAKAKEEMAQVSNYNYVVINDKVNEAVEKIRGIIENEG